MTIIRLLGFGALAIVISAVSATADEELDQMLKEALPVMHHSCETVVEETGGDEEAIVDVVRKMAIVSFANRGIDISEYAGTEEEFAALRAEFIEALRAGCEADRNGLLAGIVDNAIKTVLNL
ncbi:hypothetical protein SuNHUV7_19750 (plasmid) [Pseudoseohaeicola sp. NH-UV-7]|jgi:hypothetical protein|uniref:hypothetical protein n=1 Tax=unclassified Sulfitobacter TaxID=196795 RepID=UPI000E0A4228|nr:hypothetical protein [Sulfitobacter sp. JL08]AXI56112.1 hypothetical protein C1J05_17845 [Sulfitobacter sp. JL08]